ncbi:SDR family NAD(P)-dependent oxidoreductase [Nocardiopsis baichengensis]|uniref:SDR family NAD(P)-dependent oxidoreductase n=1 Tax=Nocardiopsis baichengensis TaxID=280240 RepID=UPI00034AD124|nr:SDR family NAD(P)-dependent oxidoreductase [Nocardiopsis baichengensis]
MRITGANVLLTGATGGIGHALARRLAAEGARLVVTGRNADALEGMGAALGARAVAADLSDPRAVRGLAQRCGPVDVLIANAALPASGDLLEYDEEEIDRALAVNLRAPIALARALVPHMAEAGRGHLAFVGSLSGKTAAPQSCLYTATKFGLRGFAHALRQDLRGRGVGVSHIQPGFVAEAGMFAATGAPVPGGVRTVTPERVAEAVVRAVRTDLAEVSVAPPALRLRCALQGQFPGLADRRRPSAADREAIRRITEAQRSLR